MNEIKYIVVHCTATPLDTRVESLIAGWRAIGWKSNGYHYVIDASGKVTQLTDLDKVANGVKGHNSHSIHVAWIGGGSNIDDRTDAQKIAMNNVLCRLASKYPDATILGHRELSPDLDGDGEIEPHEWVKLCPLYEASEEHALVMYNARR